MFTAVIVEDERPTLELIKTIVGRNPNFTIAGAFTSPLEALRKLPELRPDVVFLDVEMPRMNGIELARQLEMLQGHTKIVFTTAYKHYALEAFEVQAMDYILKPVTPASIERIMDRLSSHRLRPSQSLNAEGDRVVLQCFGAFAIRNSAGRPVRFPTRKTEELLAYFMCHPGQHLSKWRLVDLLWSDMGEERTLHNLHNTIYRLKKLLKEQGIPMEIVKTNDGYMLETGDLSYDLMAYEQYPLAGIDEARPYHELERLFALYKGPLFHGKDYLWKSSLEEGYAKLYSAIARELIRQEMANQTWTRAEARLSDYLAIYSLNEEMNGLQLQVYAALGYRDKLIKHYERFNQLFHSEMGVAPSQQFRDRYSGYLS